MPELPEITTADILVLVFLIFSVVLHEVAHAAAALACGDPTARHAGRLTLNPIPHIDWIGTILLPGLWALGFLPVCFGWARPVPVDPTRFRRHPRDDIIVSVAGVAANLVLATAMAFALAIPGFMSPDRVGYHVLQRALVWNIFLAVFNLVPIPPLDGSHVLKHLLPRPLAEAYEGIGFAGILLLILFIQIHGVSAWLLRTVLAVRDVLFRLASLPWPGAGGA